MAKEDKVQDFLSKGPGQRFARNSTLRRQEDPVRRAFKQHDDADRQKQSARFKRLVVFTDTTTATR